jgi:nucleoside-diphosphate-sugar epimerase
VDRPAAQGLHVDGHGGVGAGRRDVARVELAPAQPQHARAARPVGQGGQLAPQDEDALPQASKACHGSAAYPQGERAAAPAPMVGNMARGGQGLRTLITGGAGYIGKTLADELLGAGGEVTVLDSLMHGQEDVAAELEARGARVVRGDLRDASARAQALDGASAVVHLAAIVGDPACARDPELAREVNVDAAKALAEQAAGAGVERFVMASTCSNYGRMLDPAVPIDERGALAPVSLYAEQKVEVEQWLLGLDPPPFALTCLRFATIYGVAARMRFDLTVNEFTRDLWADRTLAVFGEQFWRPYVHVRDAARGVRTVLEAPTEEVAGEVFNVGDTRENYRKLDLVDVIRGSVDRGEVEYVHRDEDPRDYKVSFEKIAERLGFEVTMTVPRGVEELVGALDDGRFDDPFDGRYRNIP